MQGQLEQTRSSLSAKLNDSDLIISRLSSELEQIKISTSQQSGHLKLAHAEELSKEREKFNSERESTRIKFEDERRNIQRRYDEEVFHEVS